MRKTRIYLLMLVNNFIRNINFIIPNPLILNNMRQMFASLRWTTYNFRKLTPLTWNLRGFGMPLG